MKPSISGSLFTGTDQSKMNYVGEIVLALMEQECENQPGDDLSDESFHIFANCRAVVNLFKAVSAQSIKTRKKLAWEAFLGYQLIVLFRGSYSRRRFEYDKL